MQTTKKVPTRQLISMRGSAPIQDGAGLMCDLSMGALGVTGEDGNLIGIVTERDLLWAIGRGKDPLETKLAEIVNDFPIVVEGDISSKEALRKMKDAHVRHLLVSDPEGMRIVSMRDLVVEFLDETVPHPFTSAAEMRRLLGSFQGL